MDDDDDDEEMQSSDEELGIAEPEMAIRGGDMLFDCFGGGGAP